MNPIEWRLHWEEALVHCRRLGGSADPLLVQAPAPDSEIRAVEQQLGFMLPDSLRWTLAEFSACVRMRYTLPTDSSDHPLPEALAKVQGGGISWNLQRLLESEPSLLADGFLTFHKFPDGDLLALDVHREEDAPVVFVAKDGGAGHGFELAASFEDFVSRFSELGCPGSDFAGLSPFLGGQERELGIDPAVEEAYAWREWLGVNGSLFLEHLLSELRLSEFRGLPVIFCREQDDFPDDELEEWECVDISEFEYRRTQITMALRRHAPAGPSWGHEFSQGREYAWGTAGEQTEDIFYVVDDQWTESRHHHQVELDDPLPVTLDVLAELWRLVSLDDRWGIRISARTDSFDGYVFMRGEGLWIMGESLEGCQTVPQVAARFQINAETPPQAHGNGAASS